MAVCKCAAWCGDQAVAVEDGCVGVVVWYAYKGLGYLDLFYSSHKSSLPLPPLFKKKKAINKVISFLITNVIPGETSSQCNT